MRSGLFPDTNVWVYSVLGEILPDKRELDSEYYSEYSNYVIVNNYLQEKSKELSLFFTGTSFEELKNKLPQQIRYSKENIKEEYRNTVERLLWSFPHHYFLIKPEEIDEVREKFALACGNMDPLKKSLLLERGKDIFPGDRDLRIVAELLKAKEIYNFIEIVSADIHFTEENYRALLEELGFKVINARELAIVKQI